MEIKSNTIQNTLVITCTQKAQIMSIQNITMITFKEERVKIKSNSPQKSLWITCMQKKVKKESTSPQKGMWITCMQKKVKIESNSPQNMQKKLKNKSLKNALEVTCKQKRLNTKSNSSQMCPQVTFSLWISELIFSRAKSYMLSLSLTDAQ